MSTKRRRAVYNLDRSLQETFDLCNYQQHDLDRSLQETFDLCNYQQHDIYKTVNDNKNAVWNKKNDFMINYQSNERFREQDNFSMSSEAFNDQVTINVIRASNDILEFQEKLFQEFVVKEPFQFNRICGKSVNYNLVKEIYGFTVKHFLSEDIGDELLSLCQKTNPSIVMPKTFKTINSRCNITMDNNVVHEFNIPNEFKQMKSQNKEDNNMPVIKRKIIRHKKKDNNNIIPENTIVPIKLPQIFRNEGYNIKEVIAHALLFCNSKHFISNPLSKTTQINGIAHRIIDNFISGDIFKELYQWTKSQSESNIIPLCIGVTMDDTTSNQRRNRSECPICIYILNFINEDFKMLLLGYAPNKICSDAKLHQCLLNNDYKLKGQRSNFIRLLKDDLFGSYLYCLFQPLIEIKSGFWAQIGCDDNKSKLLLKPYIVQFTLDNLQANKTVPFGSFKAKKYQCRMCETENIRVISRNSCTNKRRNSEEMAGLAKKCRIIEVKSFNDSKGKGRKAFITANDDSILKDAKEKNIIASNAHSYDLVQAFDPPPSLTLCEIIGPDILHTLKSGVMLSILSQSIICVQYCGLLDKANFGEKGMAIIDDALCFLGNIKHSSMLFHSTRFINGLSPYCGGAKGRKMKNGGASVSGVVAGGIESWKMPTLLLQLLVAFICEDGKIVPNKKDWSQNMHLRRPWNPQEIICNTLGMVLDLVFVMSTREIVEFNRFEIDKIVTQVQCHLMLLQWMRQDLCFRYNNVNNKMIKSFTNMKNNLIKKNDTSDMEDTEEEIINEVVARALHSREIIFHTKVLINKPPYPVWSEAQKPHLLENFGLMKLRNGADTKTWDTELSEKFHNEVVKKPFQSSSKRFDHTRTELLKIHNRAKYQRIMTQRMNKQSSKSTDFVESSSDSLSIKKSTADNEGFKVLDSFTKLPFIIKYNKTKERYYISQYVKYSDFFHPSLRESRSSQHLLVTKLHKFAKLSQQKEILEFFSLGKHCCKFISALKCDENIIDENISFESESNEENSKFITVRAYKNDFLFINVNFEDEIGSQVEYLTQVWCMMEFKSNDSKLVKQLALVATMTKSNTNIVDYSPYDQLTYLRDNNNMIECNVVDVTTFTTGATVYPIAHCKDHFVSIPYNRMYPAIDKPYTNILKQVRKLEMLNDDEFPYFLDEAIIDQLIEITVQGSTNYNKDKQNDDFVDDDDIENEEDDNDLEDEIDDIFENKDHEDDDDDDENN